MTLGIDALILLYMILMAMVLAFNIVYFLTAKVMRDADKHQNGYFARRMRRMLGDIERGGHISRQDRSYLTGALKGVRNMLMFETLSNSCPASVRALFFKEIEYIFIRIAPSFRERDGLEMAYFAHLVRLTHSGEGDLPAALYTTLMTGLDNESMYCRDESLKALVTIGSAQMVLDALRRIDQSLRYYYPKLIPEAFNCVPREKQMRLMDEAIPWFDRFHPMVRIALLKLARKLRCDYREQFLEVLKSPDTDIDTMTEVIRYFKVCVYPPAKPELLHILTFPRTTYHRAIVFTLWTLKVYYDEETKQKILPLLSVNDAQIQEAAAEALIENGISYYELVEFYNSEDENLRRILKYMRDSMREKNLRRIIDLMKTDGSSSAAEG